MITFLKIVHKKISQSNKLYEKGETTIWYMQKCEKGQEEATAREWNSRHLLGQMEAFVPTFDRMKRYEGSWHLLKEILFPGSFFWKCEEKKEKWQEQKCTALGIVLIAPETEQFLRKIGGATHHITMSRGIIQNGVTLVTEGPLKGEEARIRKIDRHRRLAKIEVPAGPAKGGTFWAGLEITSKS